MQLEITKPGIEALKLFIGGQVSIMSIPRKYRVHGKIKSISIENLNLTIETRWLAQTDDYLFGCEGWIAVNPETFEIDLNDEGNALCFVAGTYAVFKREGRDVLLFWLPEVDMLDPAKIDGICPDCLGDGYLTPEEPCERCDGAGRINWE